MAEVSGALSRDIVVVGASVAGLHAAHAVAKMGRGLSVMVIGERVLPRYNLPLADRTGLTGPTDLDSTTLRALSQLGSQGVDLRLGARASELDLANQRILVGNGSVSYRALVIACGCAPTIPALLTEESRVYTVGQREEVSALRAVLADPSLAVAVIGAGLAGGETASRLRRAGRTVSLVDGSPEPMGRFGAVAVNSYAALHHRAGVAPCFGDGVVEVVKDGLRRRLRLSSGTLVPADVIVIADGHRPATEWLESSGLALRDGIVCDAGLQAYNHVFAAGDAARWSNPRYGTRMRGEQWTNAADQGRIAGLNAARSITRGAPDSYAGIPYRRSYQHGVRIQLTGFLNGDERVVTQRTGEGEVALFGRENVLHGALAFEHQYLFDEVRAMLTDGVAWDAALAHVGAAVSTARVPARSGPRLHDIGIRNAICHDVLP